MTEFNGQGFDDDVEDIASGAKAEDAGGGFNRHPRGKFHGVVNGVTQKDWQGQPLWEVEIITNEGSATYTIFGWKPGEVSAAKAKAAAGNDQDLKRITQAMARHKRLYVDLGLPEPETWAKGDNSIVGRFHEFISRPCTLVVQADKKDASKDRIFINAALPDGTLGDGFVDPTIGPGLDPGPFSGPETPGLDTIPF